MKPSHILVLASSVMDRLAIKYTLCLELKLGLLVQFTQQRSEAVDAVTALNTKGDGFFGFAVVIIDIKVKTSMIKKIIQDIKSTLDSNNCVYSP